MSNKMPDFGWEARFWLGGQIACEARLAGRPYWPDWLGRPGWLDSPDWLGRPDWLVGQIGWEVRLARLAGKAGQIGWEARLAGRPDWLEGKIGWKARLAGKPDWIIPYPSLSQ